MKAFFLFIALFLFATVSEAQPLWQAKLDSKVRFYQTTDFGVLVVGTDKSLYAVDAQSGDVVWRRKHGGLDETAISPVPNTDLILLSLDEGDKSRLEAIDVLSGESLWRSDKVKGDVMQLAVEPNSDLLSVVLVKKARGKSNDEVKRKPIVHAFQLSNGKELWKREVDSDVEMMPSDYTENGDVPFTLDNYRPPVILDGKVYLFYEGSTILTPPTEKRANERSFGLTKVAWR